MIRGLRVADTAQLQRLCGTDMKIFLRVGALLQSRLAFSELALESALATGPGRALIADRTLKDLSSSQFAALAQEPAVAALGLTMVDESSGTDAGWRVVVLEDELANPLLVEAQAQSMAKDAAESAATSEPASAELLPAEHLNHLSTLAATLTPAIRGPLEGLLQARADDQRAAALEQLRYAMPPLTVVSELMPMILSDGAELVRERGIGLLIASGAHSLVVDLIRALIRRDDEALARLREPASRLSPEQHDLVISAVLAALSRGNVTQSLVDLCSSLAVPLAAHRHLPRLLEIIVPTRLSLLDLVRSLQAEDAARVQAILLGQLGMGAERDALLVVLLADPRHAAQAGRDHPRLIDRGLDLLIAASAVPPERMALAAALHRLDHDGYLGMALAAKGMAIGQSYDTSVHWLISELCRDRSISAETGELLADTVRRLLRDASGPHLVAMLEQQLPALIPGSDAVRRAMVEPMVETIARFIDERSRDLVIECLTALGTTVVDPLWILLEEHPHLAIRMLAAELLPQILSRADTATASGATRRLLAGLGRAEQLTERAALLTAAAQFTVIPAMAGDTTLVREIDQALSVLGRLRTTALGYIAAGPGLGEERRCAIVGELLEEVLIEVPDAPVRTETDPATDEVTFVLDERLGEHTDILPQVLGALARIGSAKDLPRPLLRTIVSRLCLQWRRVSQWQVIWGPGNIQALAQTLGALAEHRDFPGPLRLQVCESLMPSIAQLHIARSLARVFASADGSFLSGLAGKAAQRMVDLSSESYFAEDEQEALAEVLVDFLAIPHLGPTGPSVRRRLINVITVKRTHLTSRARAKLRFVAGDLDEELRLKLDWSV